MNEYHKIQTVFKRDPMTKFKTLLEGEYSMPEFEYLQNNEWMFTEKVDGTNIRVMYNGIGQIKFGGKSDNAQIPSHLINELNELFNTPDMKISFSEIFGNEMACLYGEGYGAKIQKGGGNYRQDQGFVLFDVKIGDWWLQQKDVEDIASKLNIDIVPFVGKGTLGTMINWARTGFKSYWGDFKAEGLVAKPATELIARRGDRIITKIKCKDFRKLNK